MNDIRPPKRPQNQGMAPRPLDPMAKRPLGMDVRRPVQKAIEAPQPEPLLEQPDQPLLLDKPKKRSVKKIILWILLAFVAVMVAAGAAAYMWYQNALKPVSSAQTDTVRVEIVQGSSPAMIGELLEEKKLIQSGLVFDIYTRLNGSQAKLQAGIYNLKASESTPEIVTHLTSGNVDKMSITFLPGATLAENKAVFIKAGFNESEVDAALGKTYTSPLFTDKPEGTDLEGYIYGETYSFSSDTTVEAILETSFAEFYKNLQKDDLIEGLKAHGLNLYEAITLASIIQREVPTAGDQKQVAQVFYTRLAMDMQLGSDVTYQYAAKKMNVAPTPELDSPYNTRKYNGLPPGPIATPGLSALRSVANPASGEYVYFLSGDDDITYFAKTSEEHEKNIVDHCKIKCSVY